jgi:hypothetical protein
MRFATTVGCWLLGLSLTATACAALQVRNPGELSKNKALGKAW